ncbi:uncharacterized protein LOC116248637 isoform X1 [Nymphaea colorata]|nr:uncharacterized protein LOC116248637 isoform X1 [Nymphaea colorata]XP_049931790.1 uncharacterized protein LOC116248637 isoform X1 [Nymphaea colorata]
MLDMEKQKKGQCCRWRGVVLRTLQGTLALSSFKRYDIRNLPSIRAAALVMKAVWFYIHESFPSSCNNPLVVKAIGWFLVPESGSIQLHNYSKITVFTKFLCETISAPFEPEDDLPLLVISFLFVYV